MFDPITEFQSDDADIDIIFLLNMVQYEYPVDDPWFAAHQAYDDGGDVPLYTADQNPSPLACKSQYQYCDPTLSSEGCTLLGSLNDTYNSYLSQQASLSDSQNLTLYRILNAAYDSSYDHITVALDTDTLRATTSVAENKGLGLPLDEWKDEIVHLNSIMLAYMQRLMVAYVTGYVRPAVLHFVDRLMSCPRHMMLSSLPHAPTNNAIQE